MNPLCDLYFSQTQLEILKSSMGSEDRIGKVDVNGIERTYTCMLFSKFGLKPAESIADWEFIGTFRKSEIKKFTF